MGNDSVDFWAWYVLFYGGGGEGMHDGLEHSMSVDWDRRRRFEFPRGQIFFFFQLY